MKQSYILLVAFAKVSRYTRLMAPSRTDHCQLSLSSPATGGNGFAFVAYYFYAYQAMLEVRASGE